VHKGNVFVGAEILTEIILNIYSTFLKSKLEKMQGPVTEMI
jgi:hypothetical protein